MIDVQPYIDKLERLKGAMSDRIDLSAEVWKAYEFYRNAWVIVETNNQTFEQYYKSKSR